MTNTMKEKLANALSEAHYGVRMRLSNLEVALEQCKREEENLLDMEANHERLVKEWEEAKSAAIVAKENETSLANRKQNFFTTIDTSKKVSFKDMEEEYQNLCKELTSATRKATRAENKASALGEEVERRVQNMTLPASAKEVLAKADSVKEEPKEEVKSTSVPTPIAKKEYPTKMKMKTNKVFTKEDGTKLVFFKKYDGSMVKYDATIRGAASILLPEKEYNVEGHWSSDRWTFYVDRVFDNGNQVVPVVVSVPAAEELNKETRGTYNTMAEAFAKANAKKMA